MPELDVKIIQLLSLLKAGQEKIQQIYDESKEFQPFTLNNMDTYMLVADKLGTQWNNPRLRDLMEECKYLWLNVHYPTLRDDPSYRKRYPYNYEDLGKMLAGIAFIFGNYHLGLTCLVTALELQPDNIFVYSAVLKWSCLLGEIDIYKKYQRNPHIQDKGDTVDLHCVCRLFWDFHDLLNLNHGEVNVILDRLMAIDKRLFSNDIATIQSFYARDLIQHVLGIAALLPQANVNKYKDYNFHMKQATENSLNVLDSQIKDLLKRETHISVYGYTYIGQAPDFLLRALAITDYFVNEKAYCQALLESGCINDCESRILCVFFVGTKVGAPLRVLESLNKLHYIKLRIANDHDKLKGIRAMTSLLLGRVYEDFDERIVFSHNPSFFVQKRYSNLLLENVSVATCMSHFDQIKSFGCTLLQREQNQLYQLLYKRLNHTVSTLPLLSDLCMMVCQCLLLNPDMPKQDKHLFCDAVIKCSAKYPYHLRFYSLLARQLKRIIVYPKKYPWLFHYGENEKCLKNMVEFGEMNQHVSDDDCAAFNDAETDFILFGHIFSLDWRRRICLYLGAASVESDSWKSAFYFIESFGTSLREYLRIPKYSQLDLRFYSHEFKNDVRVFPKDFTYIQLILDDLNVLWLIRCSANFDPIVIPIIQISSSGPVSIPERFFDLLVQNDKSLKEYSSPDYWTVRESLEEKMKKIVVDIQNVWLRNFKCLFIPFNETDEDMERKLDDVRDILEEYGIENDRAEFLAMLFFHADEEDFSYMLWIFCYLQGNIFNRSMGETIPGNILNKLMNSGFQNRDLFNNNLKKDKYIVLSVSQELHSYPWESLPVFTQNILVSRIQSLHFFFRLLIKCQHKLPLSIDTEKSCLVVDSGADLDHTRYRMREALNLDNFFSTFVASLPNQEEFLECIKTYDTFVFIGHGNGSFNNAAIRKTRCKTVPILMGCSSVRIKDEGRGFDGESIVHDFIISGAPAVIGCLWMVSDGELDRFFIKFIEICASEWSNRIDEISFDLKISKSDPSSIRFPLRLLIKALAEARKASRLPLLTGASVVYYGLPVAANPAPLEAYFRDRYGKNNNNDNNNENDVMDNTE